MNISSFNFIFIFLPLVATVYWALRLQSFHFLAKTWLLGSSLAFLSSFGEKTVLVLIAILFANYALAKGRSALQKFGLGNFILFFGIGLNLSLIFWKSYLGFDSLVSSVGFGFAALAMISFLVDVYEGDDTEIQFVDLALYLTFFPKVISGPLVSFRSFCRDLNSSQGKIDPANLKAGIMLILIGLAKKLLLADLLLSAISTNLELQIQSIGVVTWCRSILDFMRLYFDFSGYSDIAIGICGLFFIRIGKNFLFPLKSLSLIEFWKRWHITFSDFIQNYVFTPLFRCMPGTGKPSAFVAIFISMTLMGVWHGLKWTFLFYGAIHGLGLVINHSFRNSGIQLPKPIGWLLTMVFVNFSLVIFRAEDLQSAWKTVQLLLFIS